MKFHKLLIIAAAVGLSVLFLSGSSQAQILGIIDDYCEEVAQEVDEAIDELQEANRDLDDCSQEYDQCLGGIFEGEPVECYVDYRQCLNKADGDFHQACSELVRELARETRRANQIAARQGVEDEFAEWFYSEPDCLKEARALTLGCASRAID